MIDSIRALWWGLGRVIIVPRDNPFQVWPMGAVVWRFRVVVVARLGWRASHPGISARSI